MLGVMRSRVRWRVQGWMPLLLLLLSSCAPAIVTPPSRPVLPEVRYINPGDPNVVAGLTQEAVESLRQRDLLWQQHVERLERQIRGGVR